MKIILSVLLAAGPSSAAAIVPTGRAASAPAEVRRGVGSVQGRAVLKRPGRSRPALIGTGPIAFRAGDVITTEADSGAIVAFSDGSRVELGPSTIFVIRKDAPYLVDLYLKLGGLRAKVTPRRSRMFRINTPSAVASVRGTEFTVRAREDGTASVGVVHGLVAVRALKKGWFWKPAEITLSAGQKIDAGNKGLGRVRELAKRNADWAISGADEPRR